MEVYSGSAGSLFTVGDDSGPGTNKETFAYKFDDIIALLLRATRFDEDSIQAFYNQIKELLSTNDSELIADQLIDLLIEEGNIIIVNRLRVRRKIRDVLLDDIQGTLLMNRMVNLGMRTSGMMHDLGNYIQILKMILDILDDPCIACEDKEGAKKMMSPTLEKMCAMREQLLDYARGKTPEKKIVKLTDIVESMVKTLRFNLPIGIDIYFISNSKKLVFLNDIELSNVVLNFVKNALQAIGDRGRIDISLYDEEDYIKLIVEDNGCGIPREDLTNIFNTFFTSGKKDGIGIGLTNVINFVQESGGNIQCTSEQGVGTRFEITFPIYSE